jgi:hypothetical protein
MQLYTEELGVKRGVGDGAFRLICFLLPVAWPAPTTAGV